jgi:hypothetical protein
MRTGGQETNQWDVAILIDDAEGCEVPYTYGHEGRYCGEY